MIFLIVSKYWVIGLTVNFLRFSELKSSEFASLCSDMLILRMFSFFLQKVISNRVVKQPVIVPQPKSLSTSRTVKQRLGVSSVFDRLGTNKKNTIWNPTPLIIHPHYFIMNTLIHDSTKKNFWDGHGCQIYFKNYDLTASLVYQLSIIVFSIGCKLH